MELQATQSQIPIISPQMAQAMEILQMSALELKAYLEDMAVENPVIELAEPSLPDEAEITLNKLLWLENKKSEKREYSRTARKSGRDVNRLADCGRQAAFEETLSFFLKTQMRESHVPKALEQAVYWVIDNLDENGWFPGYNGDGPFTGDAIKNALMAVQMMEPAGVGASGLAECLMLQLDRLKGDYSLEKEIVNNHLDEMGKNHYNVIALKTGVPQKEVRRACDELRKLNPRPGAGFDNGEAPEYIQPDIIVTGASGNLETVLVERAAPNIYLSSHYCRLLKESDEPEVREYLSGKIRQAKWLVQSVEQRKNTVIRCAQVIVDIQQAFFRHGGKLLPMTLKDVASRVDVHESTVSRAVRGKYLQCAYGVLPLGKFFSRNLGKENGASLTQADVKELLRRLIERENKLRPLSDARLCELLANEKIGLSRRTVAKYRFELGIPPATGRRML